MCCCVVGVLVCWLVAVLLCWFAVLAKLTQYSIIWPLVGKLAEIAKMLKKHVFVDVFWSLALLRQAGLYQRS